ncbi:MAG TPA: isoprenyl transferase [Candidatus Caccousia stercoris]|uniref:Isoprenyl transferase n=1 Tax=Candidatus Caccousia stercoris TaxID=2840723 RepID=A0A9D1K0Y9_9FIRM|nr:isoprenyl transferase [Candidatus Caccousia stercoris]
MEETLPQKLPVHLGIIMDGNGRWAKRRGLPRSAGHAAGAANFKKITLYCASIGIRYLTVYAFSTENWTRPAEEVSALMVLFRQYLDEALRDFREDEIAVRFLGDVSAFPKKLQELIRETEEISVGRTGMVLNIAMNYGGRAELTHAFRTLAQKVKDGSLAPEDVTEDTISSALYTAGQPDPDLIIRPSGEHRTSNFLLWQSAYAEYVVMDILWPDFRPEDLNAALWEYANRSRRFGGV